MPVSYIVIAYDMRLADGCLGIVASATTMEQANMIVKAFAFVALSYQQSWLGYFVRDASSASLYGPECAVNLLKQWQLSVY
ncbi:hypothetical protein [Dictyobacter arantiisoli]|uniref:Uncharacterized protein n=1 Tax=Dictyobacter arantiisoli TaxID=2014874 RepID=A0A5A5T9T5_9CHLR|nr:hypothetical protein [Dictyobacter arantiisoli]GCF08097.1 hypothetical protein KDI_16610 [Dictyobacter arantiisoli]